MIPDVIWISQGRLATLVDEEGHLTGAPELIVEVLSPGSTNERRDRHILARGRDNFATAAGISVSSCTLFLSAIADLVDLVVD